MTQKRVPLTTDGDVYPNPEAVKYLQHQENLFDQDKEYLLRHYLHEFVAFEDGEVLDHDHNEAKLAERVYTAYGYRPILIRRVVEKEPVLRVGGSFVCD